MIRIAIVSSWEENGNSIGRREREFEGKQETNLSNPFPSGMELFACGKI